MTTARPGVAVSVITAVAGTADPGHVAEAYASLTSQAGDIAWEWVVQLDTTTGGPELPQALTDDPRVSVGRNQSAGPALARTTALARARGDVVVVIPARASARTPPAIRTSAGAVPTSELARWFYMRCCESRSARRASALAVASWACTAAGSSVASSDARAWR